MAAIKAKRKKLTKKQLRLEIYNSILVRNKKLFVPGAYLTRGQFIRLFKIEGIISNGSFEDVLKCNVKLMQVQSEINLLLRESGLVLRSESYYSFFNVLEKANLKKHIISVSRRIDKNTTDVERLTEQFQTKTQDKTWGNYDDALNVIPTLNQYPVSERHLKLCNNLKNIK
jgi:hypothetical protein